MPPTLNHPPGLSFIEDVEHRAAVHVDAATYYGTQSFSRSRTYSHVRLRLFSLDSSDVLSIHAVPTPRLQPKAGAHLRGGHAHASPQNVA